MRVVFEKQKRRRSPAQDLLEQWMALAGFKFEKEFRFHGERRWRFDYAWPSLKIAVEFEGGHWSGGRHSRGAGYIADLEKYNTAAVMGWCVIRVTDKEVNSGMALKLIDAALSARRAA